MPRLTIDLAFPSFDALVRRAELERREPREQAAYVLERWAKRLSVPPKPVQSVPAEEEIVSA
jgi:hypothetical protein